MPGRGEDARREPDDQPGQQERGLGSPAVAGDHGPHALQRRGERRLRLLLVGEGSEKPRLQQEAAARGLGNVTFMDSLPKQRLAALLAGAHPALRAGSELPIRIGVAGREEVENELGRSLAVLDRPGLDAASARALLRKVLIDAVDPTMDRAVRALHEAFEARFGIPILTAFGATEFGGVIANWTLDLYREWGAAKRGSAGRASAGAELRIGDLLAGRPVA